MSRDMILDKLCAAKDLVAEARRLLDGDGAIDADNIVGEIGRLELAVEGVET